MELFRGRARVHLKAEALGLMEGQPSNAAAQALMDLPSGTKAVRMILHITALKDTSRRRARVRSGVIAAFS